MNIINKYVNYNMNVVGQTINWRKLLIYRNLRLPLYILVKLHQNSKCYNAFAKHSE